MATGTLIDRDESYEVLDAIRKLLWVYKKQ
jgi:hypothetical protein